MVSPAFAGYPREDPPPYGALADWPLQGADMYQQKPALWCAPRERSLSKMLTPPDRKKPGPLKTALMTAGMILLLILIGYFFGGK